jgi:WXG100 family type VII secretion target
MTIDLTPGEFSVDLDQFAAAISTVQTEADNIGVYTTQITGVMQVVQSAWSSPAGQSFAVVAQACNTQMAGLNELLSEMVQRMQTTQQNYQDAEETNTANMGGGGGGGGGGGTQDFATNQPQPGSQPLAEPGGRVSGTSQAGTVPLSEPTARVSG